MRAGTVKAGGGEENIAMTRAVARIQPALKLIIGEDTVSNLAGYFDSVSVAVSGVASGIVFGSDFSHSYNGSNTIHTDLHITQTSCHSDYVYTFPTIDPNPEVELRTVVSGSGAVTFRAPLPSSLEAGKDYTITIYLHKDNADVGFTLGDIIYSDDFIENNFYDDDFGLVTFSENTLLFPAEFPDQLVFLVFQTAQTNHIEHPRRHFVAGNVIQFGQKKQKIDYVHRVVQGCLLGKITD